MILWMVWGEGGMKQRKGVKRGVLLFSCRRLGSKESRIGIEYQIPFGMCALSMEMPVADPVVSPTGHLYERAAILKYLMDKTEELKVRRAEYETQLARGGATGGGKRVETETGGGDGGVRRKPVSGAAASRWGKKKSPKPLSTPAPTSSTSSTASVVKETEDIIARRKRKELGLTAGEDVGDATGNSFWLKPPEAKETKLPPPPKFPASPRSGKPLRLKDLIPVRLERSGSKKAPFQCPISKTPLTNQQLVLLKPSRIVVTKQVADTIVLPSGRCPITAKFVTRDDILPIVSGGTGFAAHNQVSV